MKETKCKKYAPERTDQHDNMKCAVIWHNADVTCSQMHI